MKRVALITGGSRGIGFGIASHLAANGFDLAINGTRSIQEVEDAIEKLKGFDVEVIYCQGDVSIPGDRKKIFKETLEYFGKLHVLVNNAGVAPKERKDILEATEESFDHVVSINLKGAYFLMQEAARQMIKQKQEEPDVPACIVNISSISATVASVNRGEYCVSKAGLSMATQLFAVRLGEFNIPVFEVRPGIIATDMTSGVKEKYDKLIEEGLCVQRDGALLMM